MNLVALSTGFILARERIKAAFFRGLKGKNLYTPDMKKALASGAFKTIDEVRAACMDVMENQRNVRLANIEFYAYIFLALMVHAAIVIPAIALRVVTDVALQRGWFPKIPSRETVRIAQSASRAA